MLNSPIAVPEELTARLWDLLVQGAANAFAHHGKAEAARRIERLRISPNVQHLMNDAVVTGWSHWLTHSKATAIVAAVKRDVQDHLPTLIRIRLLDVLTHPITRHDVEQYLAEWFHELHAGESHSHCRAAATELFDTILSACLSAPALRDLAVVIRDWDGAHGRHHPPFGARAEEVRRLARAYADAQGYPLVTSAHVFYALTVLQPAHTAQQALHSVGITPDAIRAAMPSLRLAEAKDIPVTAASESSSVPTIFGEAQARAVEEQAHEVDDSHLLRGMLAIAADTQCDCGRSLCKLFATLGVDPVAWAAALTTQRSWPSIQTSLGVQLSLNNI